MTHAYRQYYLDDAMGVLGAAEQARWFAVGDPFVVAGQSGWELAERVLSAAGVNFPRRAPSELLERVPAQDLTDELCRKEKTDER